MLSDAHLLPVVFARMTGLSVNQLRRFDRRGYLLPDFVHPVTGNRYYLRQQVTDGRLLAGLLHLGMPTEAAAKAVAEQDGFAVRAHLDVVDEALTAVQRTLPPVGSRPVRWRSSEQETVVTPAEPLVTASDALSAVLDARTALAAALGVPVTELPASRDRDRGWPDGPVVTLEVRSVRVQPLHAPPPLAQVLLPWPGLDLPPEGFSCGSLPRGRWAITDLQDDERGAGPLVLTEVVSAVARWLQARAPHLWSTLAVAYDADLTVGSLAIACRTW